MAAIEEQNETTLRNMLADQNVEYMDTVWLPRKSRFKSIRIGNMWERELMSAIEIEYDAPNSYLSKSNTRTKANNNHCSHPSLPDKLIISHEPETIAISV